MDLKAEAVAESLDRELDQADIIIALSNAHAHSFVENGVDSTRLLLAPLGVDTELFAFRPRPSRVAEHPPQVLFVGQITQRKGLAYLINAMDLVRQAQPDVILKLVGSAHGDILSQLPPYVVWHDAVAREHLAAHYHQADVFAFLSLAEGFAQTPLEAMACGLPVVMSRQAYGPDGPVRDGVEGFVLDARDVGGVAAKIVQLLADEATRQGMGAAAASRAREFTWERFAGKVRRDVLTVLAKRRSTSHGTR
ncbi:glycosyltransferase family 4 protein [Blastococcus sp. TF02A-35]|uniref:glycosyltransferase family 4 protein n=1 Tax=Blastococcus sp. TF02A-35 TaxID=2559612 RepID=UPI0014315433|nr:glycosyltransferase family 4 protein [Blastococcus sp. TF02A_35]